MPLTDTRDLQRLAGLRALLVSVKQNLIQARADILETSEGLAMRRAEAALFDVQASIMETEATIRGTALEHYDGTGEREPWPGVKIKLYTVVEYDSEEVLAWAKTEALNLLTLDTKAFERWAKLDLIGDRATVTAEPRAQIARDLGQYLPVVVGPTQKDQESGQ